MPYPKSPSRYPAYMFELIRKLAQAPTEPIRMRFPRRAAAHNFRQHFNAFRRACSEVGHAECGMLSVEEYSHFLNSKISLEPSYAPKEEKEHSEEPAIAIFQSQDIIEFEIEGGLQTKAEALDPFQPATPLPDPMEEMLEAQLRLKPSAPIPLEPRVICPVCKLPTKFANPICTEEHGDPL